MSSQKYDALKGLSISFPEASKQGIFSSPEQEARGLFLVPTQDVPGRPNDITGYILQSSNDQGKLEWVPAPTSKVQGTGSVWFSDSSGNPTGDPFNLYWNSISKRLAIQLNGGEPDYSIDTLGGIQTDSLLITNGTLAVGITVPPNLPTNYNLVLPSGTGQAAQVLATDGSGNLEWINNGSGGGGNVPGEGTIWFSNSLGSPIGATQELNWDNVTSALNITGAVNVNGIVTANNFKALSDAVLKKNIEPLDDALNKLRKIDTFFYKWNDPYHCQERQMGVIAQQLENIGLESLVDNTGEYKSVDYMQLIPLLIQSVKELDQKLNQK